MAAADGAHDPPDEVRRDERPGRVVHQHHVVVGPREGQTGADRCLSRGAAVGHLDGDLHVRVVRQEVGHDVGQTVGCGDHEGVHDPRRRQAARRVEHQREAVQLHEGLGQVTS